MTMETGRGKSTSRRQGLLTSDLKGRNEVSAKSDRKACGDRASATVRGRISGGGTT